MAYKPLKPRIIPKGFYPQQVEAINWLSDFINSDAVEATLSGYAGTGKTYLLNYFVNRVCNVSVCPTAPTHKAVRQIEKSLNRKGKTLQSLHGLRPNTDIANFDIANPRFDPKGNTYIKNYKLVIIDEASMITDDIYQLNRERAIEYGVKILYVGDPLQLPPVQKGKTKVTGSKAFEVEHRFNLTQIVRQEEGNPLLELFPLIRDDIVNNTNNFLNHILTNREHMDGGNGYVVLNDKSFNTKLFSEFSDVIKSKNLDEFRLLCYTNDAVKKHNKFIRDNIIKHNDNIITIDDVITSYTTIVDEFSNPIITNSEDYVVDNIREYVNSYDIKTWAVSLKSTYTNMPTNTMQVVDHTDESFVRYYNLLSLLHKEALQAHRNERASKWVKYYSFKENLLTMINFSLSGNSKAIVKKDMDYGYAITIHKSQGSTFDNVFVDLSDILYYKTRTGNLKPRRGDVNRLIYVALSRARNSVIFKL